MRRKFVTKSSHLNASNADLQESEETPSPSIVNYYHENYRIKDNPVTSHKYISRKFFPSQRYILIINPDSDLRE
ncbi:MAG: hypothetical protein ACTMH4_15185 [Sphingobacterium sp.]